MFCSRSGVVRDFVPNIQIEVTKWDAFGHFWVTTFDDVNSIMVDFSRTCRAEASWALRLSSLRSCRRSPDRRAKSTIVLPYRLKSLTKSEKLLTCTRLRKVWRTCQRIQPIRSLIQFSSLSKSIFCSFYFFCFFCLYLSLSWKSKFSSFL